MAYLAQDHILYWNVERAMVFIFLHFRFDWKNQIST